MRVPWWWLLLPACAPAPDPAPATAAPAPARLFASLAPHAPPTPEPVERRPALVRRPAGEGEPLLLTLPFPPREGAAGEDVVVRSAGAEVAGARTLVPTERPLTAASLQRTDDVELRDPGSVAERVALAPGASVSADLPALPLGGRLSLVALADGGAAALVVLLGGEPLATIAARDAWMPASAELPPANASRRLELRAAEHGAPAARLVLQRLAVASPEPLLVLHEPPPDLARGALPDGAELRVDGEPLELLGPGPGLVATFETAAGVRELTLPPSPRFQVLQPSCAPDERRAREGPRVEVDGERRVARLLAPGESLSLAVPPGRSRLRLGLAAFRDGDAGAALMPSVEVALVSGARRWPLHDGRAAPVAQDRWHDLVLTLPLLEPADDARLVVGVGGEPFAIGADGALESAYVALSEPVAVDPWARPEGVIVYLVDTLRADHLGLYGYERPTSPRLDALAGEALVFERASSPASWTRPATGSLLTGLHPRFHGAFGRHALAAGVRTLAERLSDAGYATGAIVTNPNVAGPGIGLDRGFDTFKTAFADDREVFEVRALAFHPWIDDWLARHAEQPFFLYVHTLDPHGPYDPPEEVWRHFDPDYDGPLTGALDGEGGFLALDDPAPRDVEHLVARYDAEIALNDDAFGRLVDLLRTRGRWDRTGLLFTSDHGEEFFEHGGWMHGQRLYEEQVHVPLVLKPAASWEVAPGRDDRRVSLVDVAPTLLRLLGVDDTDGMSGGDLLGERRTPGVLLDEPPQLEGIVAGDDKLIAPLDGRAPLLFDLDADPGEQRDLAAREAARAAELHARLRRALDALGAAGLALPEGGSRVAALDQATIDQLMKLGYLR